MNGTSDAPTGGGQTGGGTGADPTTQPTGPTPPDYVMNEVKLLLTQVTAPEGYVAFDTNAQANADTIKGNINPKGQLWTWENEYARENQQVTSADVDRFGYQIDIDSYFRLEDATGPNAPVWSPEPNPDATSSGLELSTGASDAVAYHDFYHLQIAFEDVWAELIDRNIGATAQEFYARWDARMNVGMGSDINDQQGGAQLGALSSVLESAQQLINVLSSQSNRTPSSQAQYVPEVASLLASASSIVSQVLSNPSDPLATVFGMDLQNIQADLMSAVAGLPALASGQPGAGAPATDAVGAAIQAVTNLLQSSQDAGARVAAFNAIPTQSIGGYDELEIFLNNVRAILDLPTVTPSGDPTAADAANYQGAFDSIALSVKAARDYVDSLVRVIHAGAGPADALNALQGPLNSALDDAYNAAHSLKNRATPAFMGPYITAIATDVDSAWGYRGTNFGISDMNTFDDTTSLLTNFLTKVSSNLESLRAAYNADSSASPATDLEFPELETVFNRLSKMLKERYRFDVFAPASINYGLLLNYRQRWQPQSYQVGNLVKTIPLGPGETRKYSTKTVVKRARHAKELRESLHSHKEEGSQTQRTDAEIFSNASQKTDFSANASGTFKIGVYDVNASTGVNSNQAAESRNTKKDQHEAVIKAAQEYRDEHKMEVSTEETRETEVTAASEIRNPNDELTVTYLFYELQRRYLVSESLHRATPVILVANDVPAPHEIDEAWLVRYDWILKRVMLDDSFLPALAYLGKEFAGQESALIILEMQVQHQKNIVDQLSRQVELANQAINAATAGVTNAEAWSLNDQRNQEYSALVKSFFDPLGLSKAGTLDDGNSDRARVDFAKEALERAQTKVNDLTGQMRIELTALQAAVDKYTAAATRHYAMEAQIDRLRLHVKDNIIYYMQAIWSHEPADQRYFRLYNLDVPVFEGEGAVTVERLTSQPGGTPSVREAMSDANKKQASMNTALPRPTLSLETKKLHQVADVDNLIGFKGNYMIFPLTDFNNYMAWYLVHNYIECDSAAGLVVSDPDPDSGATPESLEEFMQAINAQDPQSFADNEAHFEEVMLRLLSNQAEQMVIVPSDQLYIEALPGTHPILEDFKLIHRALDVKKVQAEVRHAELENLRLAARLANGEYGDPDVEKKIVIEGDTSKIAIQPDSP